MQSSLGPATRSITIGGLYGTVVAIDDETVTLEVAPGVHTRYARAAIARVVNRRSRRASRSTTPPTPRTTRRRTRDAPSEPIDRLRA